MSKRPDFALDLNAVKLDVTENVSDILAAAKERAFKKQPVPAAGHQTVVSWPPKPPRESKKILRTDTSPKLATRPAANERQVFQNVTTKLTPETKERLRQAACLQQAQGCQPNTEYAIVNQAVEEWLKRHGYAGRWKSEETLTQEAESTEEGTPEDR